MTISHLRFRQQLVLALLAVLFVSPVLAEKPSKGGGGGGQHKQKQQHHQKSHDDFRRADDKKHEAWQQSAPRHQDRYLNEHYFNDHHRNIVGTYYRDQFRRGDCPPGLAKKHNGCLPPGQAKRWTLGQQLPRDVIFYDLPDYVIRQIGYPPPGYRFVRVASDILMITIGTGLVVDAIADLNVMR